VIPEFSGHPDLTGIVKAVQDSFPARRVTTVDVSTHEATVVRLDDRTLVFVDPHAAKVVGSRPLRTISLANLTTVMRRLHTNLLIGPKGKLLVTLATVESILLALTGLWLWWRKKGWRFGRLRGSIFRISWDLHNATGLWFLIPVLAMAVTGVLIVIPAPVYRLAGAGPTGWPEAPRSVPADSTRPPLPLSSVLRIADSAVAGDPTRRLTIPGNARGAYAVEKSGATVFVDQFSAAVLAVQLPRVRTAGDNALHGVIELHTGELLGPVGQGVMTLGSLALALMTLTGVILGWKRLMILVGKMTD
jgi:uncharacterized iron-regulated membrane protein